MDEVLRFAEGILCAETLSVTTYVMSANLRLEESFLELAKDSFTSDVKVSAEHSDEIFKIFYGIVLNIVAFYF